MVNNTRALVLFMLLSASWLSSARLLPGADEEVNATASASMISAVTASRNSQPAIVFGDENKSFSKKVNVEASSLSSSPMSWWSPHYHEKLQKRRLRRNWSDEVDKGFVAFSADYRGPRHHPPKNN